MTTLSGSFVEYGPLCRGGGGSVGVVEYEDDVLNVEPVADVYSDSVYEDMDGGGFGRFAESNGFGPCGLDADVAGPVDLLGFSSALSFSRFARSTATFSRASFSRASRSRARACSQRAFSASAFEVLAALLAAAAASSFLRRISSLAFSHWDGPGVASAGFCQDVLGGGADLGV